MEVRKYNNEVDASHIMKIIKNEADWDYADEGKAEKYILALENCLTYVAWKDDTLCGYSRSIDDFGLCIYVCDLLVKPECRGNGIGRKLMECIIKDYPNKDIYVMSDADGYYEKMGYKREGSIFEVKEQSK